MLVHRKLRIRSEELDVRSLTEFLAQPDGKPSVALQRLLGVLTLIFLTLYAAAQMKAGAKALHGTLSLEPTAGIYIAAVLVVLYSYAGGIRASIWTDVAQSFLMIGAMIGLLIFSHMALPIQTLSSRLFDIAVIAVKIMSAFPPIEHSQPARR